VKKHETNFLKGQSSIEFLTIFGIAILMATPFIISADTSINELRTGTETAELENTMNKLEETIRVVESQGEPAKRTITMDIPSSVDEASVVEENAVVYTYTIQGQQVNTSRIFENQIIESGQGLPTETGRHHVEVQAEDDAVRIGEE